MIVVENTSWLPGPTPPPAWRPWPGPERPRPYVFAPLEIESVKIQTRITDQVAVTAIEQAFVNPNPVRLEGTFVFPVPKGAHLDRFAMEIDGKPVEAELLGADKARRLYEDIVRKLKDPALLEYAGRDLFKVRIFPIEPQGRKRIHLSYTQLLTADAGLVSYSLPLSTEKFSCKPVKSLSVKVQVQTRPALKSIYSPTHSVEIKREDAHHATAGFEATDLRDASDFTLYFAAEKSEIGVNLLTHRVAGDDGYFLLLAAPGLDLKQTEVLPKDVAFVLDTSGSMAGKKLEQAKKALTFCIENLNDQDRFELIRFSTEVEPLFQGLVAATGPNRSRAEEFVNGLRPMGATAIDDALKRALGLRPGATDHQRPLVVVFLTDGRPTIGVTDEDQIVANAQKENEARTRIFCFGIGTDVNTHLLDKITEQSRGFSQYVLPEEDLELKVSSFFSRIKEPILANPELDFTGPVRVSQLYPAPLPDIFKGEQLVLVGRYSGQGDSAAVLKGTVKAGLQKYAYDLHFPEACSDNDFIPRLWATRRIGYLLDQIRLHGEDAELRDEVTALARKYGVVTPYTAYLIVEDEQHRAVPLAMQTMQQLQADQAARREAARSWQQFALDSGGDSGVASALSGMALRNANAPNVATLGAEAAFGRRYGLARTAGPPIGLAGGQPLRQELQYSGAARFVAGKSFFLNGTGWVDSELQRQPTGERRQVKFGSEDYFALLQRQPKLAAWLALGPNVQFLWQSVVYEISE